MDRKRYRPVRLGEYWLDFWKVDPLLGAGVAGLDIIQGMNKEATFYCTAPFLSPYGRCSKDVTVQANVKDEDIPSMCERCGQYFDWVGILRKLVKKCPECVREIPIQDNTINFCNQHGDRRVPMQIKEVRM
jgi:hypothetical protein